MPLTKINDYILTKKRLAIKSPLRLALALSLTGLSLQMCAPFQPPALAQTKKATRTVHVQPKESEATNEIPAEIAALWRSPSPAFAATFNKVGEEPRETSIDKIRKYLQGAQSSAPFGLNLSRDGASETEKQAASYALARLLTRGKNNQPTLEERKEALALFEKASALSCLHIASLWHMSEIISPLGDENSTRALLDRINDDPAASPMDKARAQYESGQSYMRAPLVSSASSAPAAPSDPNAANSAMTQAKGIFLAVKEKFPTTDYATGSSYYLAQIATNEAGGVVTPAAVTFLKDYLRNSTNGRFSSEVADRLYALSTAPGTTGTNGADGGSTDTPAVTLSPEDYSQIAAVFYKRGDLTKALAAYDKIGPDAKLFQRAQCLSKTGHLKEAEAALLAGIQKDPGSSSYDDYATTLCLPLNRADSAALWRKILALNPKHADHALYNVAIRSEDPEAMPLLARLLQQFPTSEHAPESLWWLFWNQTKNIYPGAIAKEKEKALALIKLAEQGVTRYPQHRVAARLAFWAGKIYEKLGQIEQAKQQYELAREKYPTNYYGARARARLQYLLASGEKKHDRAFSTSPGRQLRPDNWHWPQPPHLVNLDKVAPLVGAPAMVLAVTHQGDESIARINAAVSADKLTAAERIHIDCLKSWLFLSQAMPMEGIRAAGRDLDGHPSKSPRWEIVYPWAYCEAINDAATKNSVDPYLVHALIREESRYFPMALSRSKAIGLMQLLPGTAFGVAKRIGLHISSQDEIFIPENNIKMGTNYLAYTLSRFDGMAMLAVASYNGGPNAVKHWVDVFHAKGGSDWDIFVENIPFRETRDYVRKVFGSYWTYELIYQ
ncbi:MAG: transglycosylase SLT domain-containing protein [Cyanobacteria bacterium REEB67]|nr:transglycosylase SLT domain-containing protein [Cyanobacteria bacterium REEB67]